jgi:uncharacterized protein (TIGR03435 family)
MPTPRQQSWMRLAVACGMAFTTFVAAALARPVQNPARLEFEVASVRLSDNQVQASLNVGKDSFTAINFPVSFLVILAHRLVPGQLEKLPGWAETLHVDIHARASHEGSRDDIMAMLRALLEDRLALKTHRESRVVDAYLLSMARAGHPGPGLHPVTVDCATNTMSAQSKPLAFPALAFPGGGRPACGNNLTIRAKGAIQSLYAAITLPQLANTLQGIFERPVVDNTGLTGVFDIELTYADQRLAATPRRVDDEPPPPSIREALKDQLGLVMTNGRSSFEFLVVDAITRPSQN